MVALQRIKTKLAPLSSVPVRYYFVAGILLVATLYVVTFRERTLAYNYGGETCDKRLVILPDIFDQAGSENYEITTRGGWSVGGQQLTATSLCFTPVAAPAENTQEKLAYAPWTGWVARLAYKVEAGMHPSVNASVLEKPIPVSRELLLPLSEPDATFSYTIEADDQQARCEIKDGDLACDVPALKLKQGSKYTVALEKHFRGSEVGAVVSTDIETLSPLSIIDASIGVDATVYDKPQSVVFAVDKPLEAAEFVVERVDGDQPVSLEAETEIDEQSVTVAFAEELPRQATIVLKATVFEAADGSTPLDPYSLQFKTSGGPSVTGVSVGSSSVAIGAQIVVTFDQELSVDQDIGELMSVGGGVAFQARRGNQLVFSTAGAGRCQEISIALKSDIRSPHDVSGQSAWQYKGRMLCYTVTTIGASAQGRAINAFHFGDSGPAIVYTGAIHGNEASTKFLMDRWIQELDANPSKIPAGKRVIVIPAINPDGLARGSRVNSRNVDLNRNFATSDWQKDIQHTNGSAFPGGGGEAPMSEPETNVIANFIAQQRPLLVLSYHSVGNMVISNQAGQANARAQQYSQLSGYRLSGGGGGEFGYHIGGTADDYYREKLGVPSILIELGSHSYHQFDRNHQAMWAMLQ